MEFNDFVTKLGEETGLVGLQADQDEHCALLVDDMPIHLQHLQEHDNLLIYSSLPLPIDTDARFFRSLLEINYMYQGTRGATISMKPESDEVTLQYAINRFHYSTPEALFQEMELFMNALDNVAQFVKNYKQEMPGAQSSGSDSFSSFNGFNGFRV